MERRAKKLAEIEKLRAQGMGAAAAAKRVGISEPTYYTWRKAARTVANPKKSAPPVTLQGVRHSAPIPTALLLGSPEQLTQILLSLQSHGGSL